MKVLSTSLILVVIAVVTLVPWLVARNQGSGNGGNAAAQNALKVLSPAIGEVVRQSFVTVRYDLSNSGAPGSSPNFRLRLDSRNPVTTAASEYTFTGLQPGSHIVALQLLDANNTPVANTGTAIRFSVRQPATSETAHLEAASMVPADDANLPPASSALPLLSVIGFGALLGGIASALKTR